MIQTPLPRWPDRDKVPPYWMEPATELVGFPDGMRVATPRDIPAIFQLSLMSYNEVGQGEGEVDDDAVLAMVKKGCAGQGAVFGVVDGPERVEAVIGLNLARKWFTRDVAESWFHQDLLFYVHPLHRRSRHAMKLFKFALWWGQETRMPVVMAVTFPDADAERKEHLYARVGKKIGAIFLLRGR